MWSCIYWDRFSVLQNTNSSGVWWTSHYWIIQLKMVNVALTSVAQLVGHWAKGCWFDSSQGTWLSLWFHLGLGVYKWLFLDVFLFLLSFKNILLIFRERGGREKGRETSMCGCPSHAPYWGPGPQPRHVPCLGIEPEALSPLSHTSQGHGYFPFTSMFRSVSCSLPSPLSKNK